MATLSRATIGSLAQSAGFGELPEEVADKLGGDVAYLIRELTQEAAKFARHSKRRRLNPDDFNLALKLRNLEPLYGYGLAEDDVVFRKAPASDVYFTPDAPVSLVDLVTSVTLPALPPDISWQAHWLAVEGVQPAIPENPHERPTPEEEEAERRRLAAAQNPVAAATAAVAAAAVAAAAAATATATATAGGSSKPAPPARKNPKADASVVKPIVKHELSKEQQLYLSTVQEALAAAEVESVERAIATLRADPGIHSLLPYFFGHFNCVIKDNLRNLRVLSVTVRAIEALLFNPNLYPEFYLHTVLSTLLTCVVGKALGDGAADDHWALRQEAAAVLANVCRKFGQGNTMQPRVVKTMVDALLDPTKPLTSHYGAVIMLAALGPAVVDAVVIDNVRVYATFLEPHLVAPRTATDALKVKEALLRACGNCLKWYQAEVAVGRQLPGDQATRIVRLDEVFGEQLTPFKA